MPRSARGRPASSTTARPFSPSPPRDNVHSSSRPPSLLFGAAPTGGLVVSPGLNLAALPPTPTFGSSKGSTIWPSLAHERDPMDDWADNNRGRPQRQSPSGSVTSTSSTSPPLGAASLLSTLEGDTPPRSRTVSSTSSAGSTRFSANSRPTSIVRSRPVSLNNNTAQRSPSIDDCVGVGFPSMGAQASSPASSGSVASGSGNGGGGDGKPKRRLQGTSSMPRLHQPTVLRSTSGRGLVYAAPSQARVMSGSRPASFSTGSHSASRSLSGVLNQANQASASASRSASIPDRLEQAAVPASPTAPLIHKKSIPSLAAASTVTVSTVTIGTAEASTAPHHQAPPRSILQTPSAPTAAGPPVKQRSPTTARPAVMATRSASTVPGPPVTRAATAVPVPVSPHTSAAHSSSMSSSISRPPVPSKIPTRTRNSSTPPHTPSGWTRPQSHTPASVQSVRSGSAAENVDLRLDRANDATTEHMTHPSSATLSGNQRKHHHHRKHNTPSSRSSHTTTMDHSDFLLPGSMPGAMGVLHEVDHESRTHTPSPRTSPAVSTVSTRYHTPRSVSSNNGKWDTTADTVSLPPSLSDSDVEDGSDIETQLHEVDDSSHTSSSPAACSPEIRASAVVPVSTPGPAYVPPYVPRKNRSATKTPSSKSTRGTNRGTSSPTLSSSYAPSSVSLASSSAIPGPASTSAASSTTLVPMPEEDVSTPNDYVITLTASLNSKTLPYDRRRIEVVLSWDPLGPTSVIWSYIPFGYGYYAKYIPKWGIHFGGPGTVRAAVQRIPIVGRIVAWL